MHPGLAPLSPAPAHAAPELDAVVADEHVRFDAGHEPEFDHWRWVSYWYPLGQVVSFKRDVYRRALAELAMRLPVSEG